MPVAKRIGRERQGARVFFIPFRTRCARRELINEGYSAQLVFPTRPIGQEIPHGDI